MLERPSIAGGVLTATCPDSHQCLADPSQVEVQQRHPSPQLNDTPHPHPTPHTLTPLTHLYLQRHPSPQPNDTPHPHPHPTPSPHSLISTCSDTPHPHRHTTPSPHSLISTCSDTPHPHPTPHTLTPLTHLYLQRHPSPQLNDTPHPHRHRLSHPHTSSPPHPHTPSPFTHLFSHPLTNRSLVRIVFILLFTHSPQPLPIACSWR
ncbi:hypothetical protein Pcinc_036377 [Petrolisthes cinctipes]|uniref:Uncharacterized protein n=1 Tax=Petrolisthes cinctipes TaxID=88211 RepID=A0AAE1EMM0_PETCI|nr:hypothetical protein Pcinc_036377 [Petrolisthes cinctipes]